jgi:hypothetical protein
VPEDVRRVTLREAATMLGVSEGAVRKRVARGTIRSELGEDGRRYVYVAEGTDGGADNGADASSPHEPGGLTSELRDRLRYVEGQLEAERQAHAEARRLLAAALERIPAIEAPQEASEAPETVQEPSEPRPDAPGAQEGARRPWWRRVFGG